HHERRCRGVDLPAVAAGPAALAAAAIASMTAATEPEPELEPAVPPTGYGWRFIDLALLGRNRLRTYVLTLLAVILVPTIFMIAAFVLIFFTGSGGRFSEQGVRVAAFAAAFASLAVAGITLALSVAYIHRRPWLSLISVDPRLDWRRLA